VAFANAASIREAVNAVHDLPGHERRALKVVRNNAQAGGSPLTQRADSRLSDYRAAIRARRVASSAGKKPSIRISCKAASCAVPKVVTVPKNRKVVLFHL
jgi:hypothetical protein